MSDTRIQWHPAFCSAMELTLRGLAEEIRFSPEYSLGRKPMQCDLLIEISGALAVMFQDAVWQFLKRYNLMEFKSPKDALNIDVLYKMFAYGCLFKALHGKNVNDTLASEITLTIVRHSKPVKLLKLLSKKNEEGIYLTSPSPGIYRLTGNVPLVTQIICTRELPEGEYIWLKALSNDLSPSEVRTLMEESLKFDTESRWFQLARSVVFVAWQANKELFDQMKQEEDMKDDFAAFMKPEIDAAVKKQVNETINEAVSKAVAKNTDEIFSKFRSLIAGGADLAEVSRWADNASRKAQA